MDLRGYMNDGANYQARAVLAFLGSGDGIEESWCDDRGDYLAKPTVARWENCREQGYVISLHSRNHRRQLNVTVFEHRNSDSICAVMWEQKTMNHPTIDTAVFGDIYKDKYDTSFSTGYGKIDEMATWISGQLSEFWVNTENSEAV